MVVFIQICVLHTALVLFGSISPDMCILYTLVLFGCISPDMCIAYTLVLFFGSLYIQVKQGFIHDDHEDLINKHVMMIRVTDNI